MAESKRCKVVVTGIGLLAPTGVGTSNLFSAIQKGESAASNLSDVSFASCPVKHACKIKNYDPTDFISFKTARHMTRCSQLSVTAAKLSVQDSKLNVSDVDPQRLEVYEGTSIAGMDLIFRNHEILLREGCDGIDPQVPIRAFAGSGSGEIAIELGLSSRSITICSGSASASDAIGFGFERIKSGQIDIALVGGAETPINPPIIASLYRTGVLSTRQGDSKTAFRPFSLDRDGFVLGEGAGFLVLENDEHAKSRGAKIYAELAGFGNSCDAYHMITPRPDGEGIRLATERALKSANLSLLDVDYINAHGTATKLNDRHETLAFKKTYGPAISRILISSTKPITGHLLGACGAIEAIICVLALQYGFIPPTINYFNPDPECDLNYVPNQGLTKNISIALSYTYGIGGKNSTLVLRKCASDPELN